MRIPRVELNVRLTTAGAPAAAAAVQAILEPLHIGEPLYLSVDEGVERLVGTWTVDGAREFALRWEAQAGTFHVQASKHIMRGWILDVWLEPGEDLDAVRQALTRMEAGLSRLARRPELMRATLERPQDELARVPGVAFGLVSWAVLPKPFIAGWFVSAEACLDSGWESVEHLDGDMVFLKRATGAVLATEFRQAVEEHAWALARVARPGEIEVMMTPVPPEELSIHRQGPRRLERVGIDGSEVEFSCILGPGEHLAGWEICEVGELVAQQPMRVVFFDGEQARAEARPLRTLGVRVCFLGAQAELVDVE